MPGGGRAFMCDNCGAWEVSGGDRRSFRMIEPTWSNCVGPQIINATILTDKSM